MMRTPSGPITLKNFGDSSLSKGTDWAGSCSAKTVYASSVKATADTFISLCYAFGGRSSKRKADCSYRLRTAVEPGKNPGTETEQNSQPGRPRYMSSQVHGKKHKQRLSVESEGADAEDK